MGSSFPSWEGLGVGSSSSNLNPPLSSWGRLLRPGMAGGLRRLKLSRKIEILPIASLLEANKILGTIQQQQKIPKK